MLEEVELRARGAQAKTSNKSRALRRRTRYVLPEDGLDLRDASARRSSASSIEQALQRSRGTVAQAARLLNLRRTTLVEKLRKLGMTTAAATFATED